MVDLIITSSLTHSLMLVLPIALAALLRLLRCRGWPVLGGLLAGVLLGPAVLGRIAPDAYDRYFERGASETTTPRPSLDGTLTTARPNDDPSRWTFQRPFRSYTSAVLVISCLGAGLLRDRRPTAAPWGGGAMTGLGAALVPATLGAAAAWLDSGELASSAVLVAAAVAVGPRPMGAERRDAAAGLAAVVLAVTAAVVVLNITVGLAAAVWSAMLLALPIAWFVPTLPGGGDASRRDAAWSLARAIRGVLRHAFVPSLAACAVMRVRPPDDAASWLLAVALAAVAVVGRPAGAWLGRLAVPSARRRASERPAGDLATGLAACASPQLAIVAIAVHIWALPQGLATGLILGAAGLAVLERPCGLSSRATVSGRGEDATSTTTTPSG